VSGQKNDSILLEVLEYFPNVSSGAGVHSGSGFVENDELGVSDEGDSGGEPSPLPSGQVLAQLIRLFLQVQIRYHLRNLLLNQPRVTPLEHCE